MHAPAPDIRLQDQHGQAFDLRSLRGRVVVLLAGDRSASDQNRDWGRALVKRYGSSLAIIGIADTRGVPFFLRGSVKKSFAKDRVRVLLDWEGRTFEDYRFLPGTGNIVVIDRAGRMRSAQTGPVGDGREEQLFRAIDRVVREGS